MKDLVYPQFFFSMPFADNGNKQIPPDNPGPQPGRTSLENGFPVETQMPLNGGGIAPNRLDINGVIYQTTAMNFWQQSGGQFIWSSALNYKTPNMVFYNGRMWWCLADNGPNTIVGVQQPGNTPLYWQDLLEFLISGSGGGGTSLGQPVGSYLWHHSTTAPDGYLPCNGSSFSATQYPQLYQILGNRAVTPDYRGYFFRAYDTRNTVDPDGAARTVGSIQADAMQPITGTFPVDDNIVNQVASFVTGAFVGQRGTNRYDADSDMNGNGGTVRLDSSRQTRTASETRPKNVAIPIYIKHD